jgi:hypothetical protein
MTMNKKEKAELALAKHELALHRTFSIQAGSVERDLPPPAWGEELTKGWDFNTYSTRVFKACSDCVHHGVGWDKTDIQSSVSLYSTRDRAVMALRYSKQRECMKILLEVDDMIGGSDD